MQLLKRIRRIFPLSGKTGVFTSPQEPEAPRVVAPSKAPATPHVTVLSKEPEVPCVDVTAKEPAAPRVVAPPQEPEAPQLVALSKQPETSYVAVSLKEPEVPCVDVTANEPEKLHVVVSQKEAETRAGRSAFPVRGIVFSDTDNDVNSVRNTLRFMGILNGKDRLADNLAGIGIFHTGDLVDKKNPDTSVVKYWQDLQQDALTRGCHIKLMAGNHEQEIWQKIRAGETFGLGAKQVRWLNEFIEGLDLFYVAGPVLFMHGYPTLEFLRTLLHFKETTGKDLNCFNADHYKKAFRSIKAMKLYAYERESRQTNYLLYDVADASRYYKKQGRLVGVILAKLQIGIVIHGHRPQHSGVQVDYEFGKWIPNIRMIGNDTIVRRRGIGATVIRTTPDGALDMVFINTKTGSKKLRKRIQKDLRELGVFPGANCSTGAEYAGTKSAAQG